MRGAIGKGNSCPYTTSNHNLKNQPQYATPQWITYDQIVQINNVCQAQQKLIVHIKSQYLLLINHQFTSDIFILLNTLQHNNFQPIMNPSNEQNLTWIAPCCIYILQ